MSSNIQLNHGLPSTDFNDHEEKPSQRVPSPFLILLLAFYLLVALVTKQIEDELPRVIAQEEIANDDTNKFSEVNAKKYLDKILGNQPRVSGTKYHFVKTRDIKELVDNIASSANLPVATDWQFVDGNYWLGFKAPQVNYYQNVSNIIAVLEGESGFNPDGTTGTSLLANCHYDSVPFAMGASDNGVFCAAMAEVLEKLSRRKKKLKHNVIFLFNGAEENVLLGSHGFLKHPWSKGVTNVINLDSAGMNGKPSVFQVTDPRVLEVYRKTNAKPNAQGLGEVLFASGIIPSDTDFRIFRDFGDIHGVDIAFTKGGNVYHTRNDKPELIQDGVIQNAGDMLLSLIRDSADQDELENKEPKSTVVYYDYIGLYLFTYSSGTALIVDLSAAILGLASVFYYLWLFGLRKSHIQELLWSVFGRILCGVSGVLAVVALTLIMILTTTQMRYLSEQWMIIPLYWIPYFIACVIVSHYNEAGRNYMTTLNRSIRTLQTITATRLLLCFILLLLCIFPSMTNIRYIITVPLVIMSISSFINISLVRYGRIKAWQHLLAEVFLALPATMFAISLAYRFLSLLIPIMGRSGSNIPDFEIAVVCIASAAHVGASVSGIELLFGHKHFWAVMGGVSAVCVALMLAPLSPYRGETTTQRHHWFHTQMTTFDANLTRTGQTSGVLITKFDAYSVKSALEAIKTSPLYVENKTDNQTDSRVNTVKISDSDLKITTVECEERLYCDLPLFRPRFAIFTKGSLFVKMSPPNEFKHSFQLVNRSCVEDVCVFNFVMDGPAHNTIVIWPRENITVKSWSLEAPLKATTYHEQRPVYVIIQSTNTYSEYFETLQFNLTISVPKQLQSSPILDVFHHAHKIYNPEDFTSDYQQLIDVMPDYFNIATFLTFKNNYVF